MEKQTRYLKILLSALHEVLLLKATNEELAAFLDIILRLEHAVLSEMWQRDLEVSEK